MSDAVKSGARAAALKKIAPTSRHLELEGR